MTIAPYEKVVIRYRDGRTKKCEIQKYYSFTRKTFKAITHDGKVEDVPLDALKAIFFVQALEGLGNYHEKKCFFPDDPRIGKRVEVEFFDGEVMRGRVLQYDEKAQGFYMEPADPNANNRRVFVIHSAIRAFKFLDAAND